jgi:hypothetical protein
MKRRKVKDYCMYTWEYDPNGKSKHQRNLKRCIYDSFTYKLEDDKIPFECVGNTFRLIVNGMVKVNPVEMTLQFMDNNKTYDFNSRSNLYNMVKDKCQPKTEELVETN